MHIFTRGIGAVLCIGFTAAPLCAQFSFTNGNTKLHSDAGISGSNADQRSGNSVTVVDINNDGLDDILRLDDNQYVRIEYQQIGGTFNYVYVGDIGNVGPWGMSAADVDHNGYKDILICGGSQAKLVKLNNTGTGFLGGVVNLPNGNVFCQNGNFMDVNNDGWEDIFVCNDVGESRIWVNNGSGSFPVEAANGVIDFDITPGNSGQSDESGNYGSVWTDFDNDGDVDFYVIHCRQGQSPGDIRRTNRLFVNNGNGTYTEDGAAYGLASNDQDWTGSFGDIDNDGDFDLFLTKHDVISGYYINPGNAIFSQIPSGTLAFGNMPMQSQFEDFDNDGFVDLIITGDNDHRIYRNNGNGTFTDATPPELAYNNNNMLSFASGDLNHDGRIDLYASYGGTYNNPSGSIDDIYWMNSVNNGNHFLTLDLHGTQSTDGALGARAYIYGSWGVQTREVRASESYGTCNSFQLHFGLGQSATIDSVIIDWPASGSPNTVIYNPSADQFLVVIEGDCVSPNNVITYSGMPYFCVGQSLTLNAPTGNGYSYVWSDGSTSPSISVSTTGDYSVQVTVSGNNCSSISAPVHVVESPDETPVIFTTSETEFCQGDSALIQSSSAISYLWPNGDTTQSTYATTTGYYAVTIQGTCQTWTSDSIYVDVFPAPAPSATNITLNNPSDTIVTATGNNISWYDAAQGGNLLGTGSSYITPVLTTTTTYYAQDEYIYGGGTAQVGQVYHSGTNYNGTTYNGYEEFNVLSVCTLNAVKVYTNTPGTRIIELRNSGGTVLQSATVNLPADTSIVTLNFPLTPANGYQLGTNSAQNTTSFGNISPILKRSSQNVNYPYTVNNLISITGSSAGTGNFYYFYDWEVELPSETCISDRTPVTVTVLTLGTEENASLLWTMYPNPTQSDLRVEWESPEEENTVISVLDITGRKVQTIQIQAVQGSNTQVISLESCPAGIYAVQLQCGERTYNRMIVKE